MNIMYTILIKYSIQINIQLVIYFTRKNHSYVPNSFPCLINRNLFYSNCKLPVKYVLQNRKISPDSVRFVQIRLRVGTNSIKLYQFGTDLL